MQQQGSPLFIHAHSGAVKGIAFSPKDRYIFCSGGTDGKVNVYNSLVGQNIMTTRLTSPHAMRNINAVKFNADGSRILTMTSKRLSVIDAERGELICSYDNCAYSGKDKAPLASDPKNPYLAICGCTNGKGLITFDLRKQHPAHFALNLHSTLIRDIMYLDESWPFGDESQGAIVSLSLDGVCKVRTADNHELHIIDVKHKSHCVAVTPPTYSSLDQGGFESIMTIGGDSLSSYIPVRTEQESRLFSYDFHDKPMYTMKYTSNGHFLYCVSNFGQIRRYRRKGTIHLPTGEVYSHNDKVIDMDISPNDEFLVSASKDGSVGILCLGHPSHGWTGFKELA